MSEVGDYLQSSQTTESGESTTSQASALDIMGSSAEIIETLNNIATDETYQKYSDDTIQNIREPKTSSINIDETKYGTGKPFRTVKKGNIIND